MGKRLGLLRGARFALPLGAALFACGRTQIWGGVTFEGQTGDAAPFEAGEADVALDSVAIDREVPDAHPDSTLDAPSEDAPPPGEGGDSSDDEEPAVLPAPRLLSPLSTATVTSQTPLLRWALATGEDGAAVDVCRDRACTTLVTTFQVAGSSAMPPVPLTQGVYFWRVRGAADGAIGKSFSKVWEFFVGARSAPQNVSWGTVPDVNGDGFADVLVTALGMTGKSRFLFVYLGGLQGVSTSPATFAYGTQADAFMNEPVASAGDVNGDGFADVVVGLPQVYGTSPGFLLYSGGPDGLAPTPTVVASLPGSAGEFGWAVSSAGDVNGDGYCDVVACSNTAPDSGCFVYLGGEGGLSPVPSTTLSSVLLPSGATGTFGSSAASAGDINGDGYGDLVFGTTYQARYVAVYLGSAAGLSATPTFVATPHLPDTPDQDPGFGESLACAGDTNGDGFADVIIGSPGDGNGYDNTGSTYLYLGSPTGLSAAPLSLDEPTPDTGAAFGSLVAGAGDVDGDGYDDLLAATGSQAYLYFGGPAGPSGVPVAFAAGQANFFYSQGALAGGGDVNGDGFADVLVGAPDANNYAGGALVYPGSPSGPTVPWTLTRPAGAGFFGASLARVEVARRVRVRLL